MPKQNLGPQLQRYSIDDVRRAIAGVRAQLGLSPNKQLQEEFDAGLQPNLLVYGKLQPSANSLSVIEKYLVGATSFLRQPSNYYDIFRACRSVKLVQVVDKAISELRKHRVPDLDARLARLVSAMGHDTCDAVIFELAAAARYAEHPQIKRVEFIKESPTAKTADFLYETTSGESFVECKRIDRSPDHSIDVRNIVRDLLNFVIGAFRKRKISVLFDITFHRDPGEISRQRLLDCCFEAFRSNTTILDPEYTICVARLAEFKSDQLHLFPSPAFMWNRYGYRIRSDWFGVVNQYVGTPAFLQLPAQGANSSWIETVDWDAGAKWKISDDAVLAKYRRFAFDGVFKGLEQIKTGGPNSVVHVWLETEYFVGLRKKVFQDLLSRISRNPKISFGWLIVNETLFDVSPKGFFDLIEHAHFVKGKTGLGKEALVHGILMPLDAEISTREFGVGTQLPDIDEL